MKFRIPKHPWPILTFVIVVGSFLLFLFFSPWFMLLAPIGLFIPGLGRRLGFIHDMDEFRLSAQNEAAWYSLMTAFFIGILYFSLNRAGMKNITAIGDQFLVLCASSAVIYAAVYLFRFHEGKRAALTILISFAVGWALFIILSTWGNREALLMEFLVCILPYGILIILSIRFPRVSGVLCLTTSIGAAVFFRAYQVHRPNSALILGLICLPLLLSGLGLLIKPIYKENIE